MEQAENGALSVALVGMLLSGATLGRLVARGLLTRQDAVDIIDQSLLSLEEHQSLLPNADGEFRAARSYLQVLLREFGQDGAPGRPAGPP